MTEAVTDWRQQPLAALMRHILDTHHRFCREQGARVAGLFADELAARGQDAPLLRLQGLFTQVQQALTVHMAKEEQVLFPMIGQLEQAAAGQAAAPRFSFGSIAAPIRMMDMEHREAERWLARLKELSNGFTPATADGPRARELYAALAAFDRDLAVHTGLEDGIVFPRAVALEAQLNAA